MILDTTRIKMHGMKVEVSYPLESEDASGNSSSSAQAETGNKAKTITVNGTIRYIDEANLRAIIDLADGKEGSGKRKVFTIVDRTVKPFNIRQVQFKGTISAREKEDIKAWQVSFELVEFASVAEKKEERNPLKALQDSAVKSQTPTGSIVSGANPLKALQDSAVNSQSGTVPLSSSKGVVPAAGDDKLTRTEKILKWVESGIP